VQECAGADLQCSEFPVSVTAGFTGVFTTTFSVRRLVPVFTFLGLRVVDCTSAKAKCAMLASDGSRDFVTTPLTFTTAKPVVKSALLAGPRTGLHDNARVRVGFVGFSSYQPISMIECTSQALTNQDTSFCDPNTQMTTTTPAFGTVPTATFFAKRVLETGNGLVDCKAKAGSCILLATTEGNGYGGGGIIISSGSSAAGGLAAASNHPSARAAAALPASLNKQALKAAAAGTTPGIASIALSFS